MGQCRKGRSGSCRQRDWEAIKALGAVQARSGFGVTREALGPFTGGPGPHWWAVRLPGLKGGPRYGAWPAWDLYQKEDQSTNGEGGNHGHVLYIVVS